MSKTKSSIVPETNYRKQSYTSAVAEQTGNNSTGWIGFMPGNNTQIGRGQTFLANSDGDLQIIEVYSNVVIDPCKVFLTVHLFDVHQKIWGPAIASSTLQLDKSDTDKWVTFNIGGLHLNKGKTYGFRIESNDTLIGIGEAVGSASQPLPITGQEWKFVGNQITGDAYSYFSLAFKVGIRA